MGIPRPFTPGRISVLVGLVISFALFLLLPGSTLAADPCPGHSHSSGVWMDCWSTISATSSQMKGSATTQTRTTNDRIHVRGNGRENCWGRAIISRWNGDKKKKASIVSVKGKGQVHLLCGATAWVSTWSLHHAKGADLHSAGNKIPHPNQYHGPD